MSSRSASALLDAALAVPFDPEQEDRRQLQLASQERWPQGPVEPSVVDVAPEAPSPLVANEQRMPGVVEPEVEAMLDAQDGQSVEPPLPVGDDMSLPPAPTTEENLPPVQEPGAGSREQGASRQGGGPRRSASALLAQLEEPGAGSGNQGAQRTAGAGDGAATARRSAAALLADIPEAPVNVEGRSILGTIGDAFKRGWTMGDLAREMEAPAPNADRVFALQQEMRKLPPSPEYVATMSDEVSPQESWQAFKSNPVAVLGELMGESLAAFGNQMIEKAPNRVAIGLGAGAALGAPVVGIGAVPGGFMGAGAGFAEASGSASYALEMSSGILEALERSGVPMDDPAKMRAALADPERMQLAREFAQRKAVPIAIFDGGSALIAGRLGGKPASALAKVGEGFAETFLQGALGAAGEASGQLAQSGEIRSARAILAEGVAELPTGLAEIGVGAMTQNAADANRPAGTAPAAAAAAGAAPSGVAAPWQAAREQATTGPTVTRVEVVGDDVFGEPTTAAVERAAAPDWSRGEQGAAARDLNVGDAFKFIDAPETFYVVGKSTDGFVQFADAQGTVRDRPLEPTWAIRRPVAPAATGDARFAPPAEAAAPAPAAVAATPARMMQVDEAPTDLVESWSQLPANNIEGQDQLNATSTWSQNTNDGAPTILYGEVKRGDAVVGRIQVGQRGDIVEIDKVWVAPSERRKGVAKKLIYDAMRRSGVTKAYAPNRTESGAKLLQSLETEVVEDGETVDRIVLPEATAEQFAPSKQYNQQLPQITSVDISRLSVRDAGEVRQLTPEQIREYRKYLNEPIEVSVFKRVEGRTNGEIRISDGHHRVAAARALGITRLPAKVKAINAFGSQINELLSDQRVATSANLGVPSTADTEAAPAQAKRRIQRKLRPDSGAIDLSIVEDLVQYGKAIYRTGMTYAQWAAEMTREFGARVGQFLREAFDRIVAAYQDSIYSDETGAVGGRRPIRFKRSVAQLEELAKDSAAFKTWFDDFRKYLEQDFLAQFPEYAPLVNEFLSATSAATSVTANVPIMVKELKHFLETGEIRTNFEAHANNLRRAVAGQKLEGPKISEYSDAVFGNPDAIPVDRHIAQIMFGVKAPSARQIAAAKRRIREIALRLNWEPRQVMAALWAANQKLNNQPSESYERHLERFKGELLSILAADRSGEGRGLQAARRIADRISTAGRAAGSAGDGARAAKARISAKVTSQSGAIDVSILEDLVEYGRTVYRAGMDYATWAAAMTREFGARVGRFLREAFDRIVAAYQASRFSDTTGAVGDVRPKARPRQFEAKAAQNEALAPETRARLGSEYIPISLNAAAQEAKDWINANGLEAAKVRIANLAGNDAVPSPLDFAIGIEASGRLSATGDHAGAAGIVSTMSQRATSLGQTISVLAMMARLTPEGIVFYGQNIVERYINTLSPEAQERIRALQAEVEALKTALAEMKFERGSEVIRTGKLGDEKVQDRIKRRVKARVAADLGPAATGPEVTAETKARTQGLNRQVREVLLSDAKQSEMTKQITEILTSQGNMPAAEAEAVAKSIVGAFTRIVAETRRNYVQAAKRGGGARKSSVDALLKLLTSKPDMTDAEFTGEVSLLMGLPAMTPGLARELRTLAQRYENATDPDVKLVLAAMMFERAHEVVPADFWVKVRAFAYLSMLFAPKTWIRNVIGNQIQWIFNVGRDAVVSGIMDPAMSLLTGKRTSAGLKLGARLKGLLAPIEDVRRGYLANKQFNPEANFLKNFAAGVNHLRMLSKLTTQNKFEIADVRDVGARIFSSKFMRAWEGMLSISLGAGDRAFWMSQFRASLAQMQAAAEKNGEWTGQPTPEMIEAAFAEAAYSIYQNQNVISANANKIRGALNRLTTFGRTDQYGLGTGLLAFTQVPGSITLRGLVEWSPLGMIPALYRGMRGILYASAGGRMGAKFDQAAFNKEFTQALLGTGALYAAGYYLYALGVVTASREDDDDLEAMRRASGGGAYRINLTALRRALVSGNWFTRQEGEDGDVVVPYDWAQPVAITFAAGAELAAQVERSGREQLKKGLAEKAGMAALSLAAGAKSLEELPLLSGLSSFMRTWGYGGPLEAVVSTVSGMPSQFVPQLVRQAGQINDNIIRETRGGETMQKEFMRILASMPGYSTKFPARFDITGQAIQRYQYGGNSILNVFFSPAMASEVKRNPVLQEVSRLVNATGDVAVVPRQVRRSATINGQQVDLTNEQLAAYQFYLGNFTMSHFTWRMAAPVYARLPDEVKVKMLSQDLTDIDAAVRSAVLGADPRRLTRRQLFLRQALVNSPLGQSVPPR